jgi:hypothetical protein
MQRIVPPCMPLGCAKYDPCLAIMLHLDSAAPHPAVLPCQTHQGLTDLRFTNVSQPNVPTG